MNSRIGGNLGPYRILEKLGRGGMATVHKAYQPALDRLVAVKVLPAHLSDEPGFARRFKREAHAVAKLEHPNILPVYDYGREKELTYIVMRYIEGGTLKDLLGKPLEFSRIVQLINQIAEALDHAHENGVVHRDVKPSNVLLDRGNWALLSDFGVARMVEATQQITAPGVGIGTPTYMSPEQGQGKKADRRSDVYSLGVILYEMLTGRVPYEADTPLAVVWKHVNEPLPLPRSINAEIPEGVERVVLKAMAKLPADRFQTAVDLARALQEAVREALPEGWMPSAAGEALRRGVMADVPRRALKPETVRRLRWLAVPVVLIAAAWLLLARTSLREVAFGTEREAEVIPDIAIAPSMDVELYGESEYPEPDTAIAVSTEVELHDDSEYPEPDTAITLSKDVELYDDFENPEYEGAFDPRLWLVHPGEADLVAQREGMLVVTMEGRPRQGLSVVARRYAIFTLEAPMYFQADLMVETDVHDGAPYLHLRTNPDQDSFWQANCNIASPELAAAQTDCWDSWTEDSEESDIYRAYANYVDFGTWHTFRIEVDPATMDLAYYVDGYMVGSHVPTHASDLKDARFMFAVGIYAPSSGAVTGYIDNVHVGRIAP